MPLSDFVSVISGFAFKSKDFVDSGIPVIKIANIKHENVVFDTVQYLPPEFLSIDQRFHVQPDDVMISLTGSHLTQPNSVVGRVARYRHTRPALLNQRAGRIVINEKGKLDQNFLYYFLRQDNVMRELALTAGGAANQANISPKDVGRILIPDVSFDEQVKLGQVLSTYDNLIENNRRRIVLLEDAARHLYKEWFVRFRFPGHEHVPIVDGVPEGWSLRPLIDLAELTMGQSPKSEFYNDTGDGLPFHQGVTNFGFRYVSHKTYCTKPTRLSQPGDILFSVRAPVGRLNMTNDQIVLGRGLSAIRSRTGHQSFLFYQLKSFFFKEDMVGGGAIFAAINKKQLESQELLCPPEYLVTQFDEFASASDRQIKVLTEANEQLTRARDILLPKLMCGEIKV